MSVVGAFARLARDLVAKANAEEARAAADQMRAAQQVAVVLASAAACEGSPPALEDGEVNDVVPAITSAASELSAARLAASDAAAASTSETAAMLRGALLEMSPPGATHETTVETTARDMVAAVQLPRERELRPMQHRAVAAVALRGANIFLVDPPASGKSVVGFALAARGDALWITGT